MNLSPMVILLAFSGGALGSMFSSMCMIVVWCAGMLLAPMIQSPFFDQYILGVLFVPVCAFAGGIPAVAFAANTRKHDVTGTNLFAPLWNVTGDWMVHAVGGLFAVVCYSLTQVFGVLGIPGDIASLAIVFTNLFLRKVCYKQKLMTCPAQSRGAFLGYIRANFSKVVLSPVIVGIIAGVVVFHTKNPDLMFQVCGVLLVMLFVNPAFPITHHIGGVAGAFAFLFGQSSVGLSIVFGVIGAILAQILFFAVVVYLNYGKMRPEDPDQAFAFMSHIDPPSCTLATCTILANLIARAL